MFRFARSGSFHVRRHPHSRRTTAQPEERRSRHPHRRDDGRHRTERLGQIQPGVRHAVRRGPAPLRRNLQRLRAPVPRSHGSARGGPCRRRAAGDRDRSDQPGAQLALDRRHDDRAERSPEAAVRARGRVVRPPDRQARASRHAADDSCRAEGTHRDRGSARGDHVPGRAAGQHERRGAVAMVVGGRLHACAGRTRGRDADRAAQAARRGGRPIPLAGHRDRARHGSDRARAEARQRARERLCARRRRQRGAVVALFDRAALPRQRLALQRPAAGAVLIQLGLWRVRDVSRLRSRDRRRLRTRDPG